MDISVFDNARQVVMDGYVSAFEDGDDVKLHWVSTRGHVGSHLGDAIVQMIADGDVVVTAEEAFAGTYFLELAENLVDCS